MNKNQPFVTTDDMEKLGFFGKLNKSTQPVSTIVISEALALFVSPLTAAAGAFIFETARCLIMYRYFKNKQKDQHCERCLNRRDHPRLSVIAAMISGGIGSGAIAYAYCTKDGEDAKSVLKIVCTIIAASIGVFTGAKQGN